METIKIALLGFGTVGSGVYEIIRSHQERLRTLLGKNVEIVGVLINDKTKERHIDKDILVTTDIEQIFEIPDVEVVIEAIVGVEPGFTYLSKAIDKGYHIITANKELFAHKGQQLKQKAADRGVRISYEASVAGGIPIIGTLRQLLQVNSVVQIEAILNGTSNFILSEIRGEEISFEHALQSAQQNGFAEADPSNDIDGHDAFYKIVILFELLFGRQPKWELIRRKGIRNIRLNHIRLAESFGFRIKHVASLSYENGSVEINVEPNVVPEDHPLYSVEGVDNAVVLTGDLIGELKLQGPGAGKLPTGSAIIEDLVNIFNAEKQHRLVKDIDLKAGTANEFQTWFVIGNAVDPFDGLTLFENSINDQGKFVTARLIEATEGQVKQLLNKNSDLVIYPFAGKPSQPIKKAFVSA
ncbi:homoserine dehydrogenase [Alkalihalobacillus sp. AL-G]|uniref:homoserine dehydrogenase n=1 Tax=Alkalihalobacillus sp. AL-G TaxID=2926399 RepID=UPI00272BC5E3|nr:homoserine dehydrogenase [Alkalihalobacillus sp. AL-G]WLD94727.1 homoserine dehydrogenase [Alkalihalobacillus sp. AL-G]